ncbi:MAG: hypothetical protein M3N13_03155, partial [Candidatus Eremiobacteraeota bacterium]|nr:hypothetical protein [Candidatus Eremiobacteraeota bacterium]
YFALSQRMPDDRPAADDVGDTVGDTVGEPERRTIAKRQWQRASESITNPDHISDRMRDIAFT